MNLDFLDGLIKKERWQDAWRLFEILLVGNQESPRVLLLGSQAAFGCLNVYTAKTLVERALALHSTDHEPELLGSIRAHLGRTARYLGDNAVARTQFQLFLEELPVKYPAQYMGEGYAHYYLALIARSQNDEETCIRQNHRALGCFERDDLPDLKRATLQNLAWVHIMLGRLVDAEAYLAQAEPLALTTNAKNEQMICRALFALKSADFTAANDIAYQLVRRRKQGDELSTEHEARAVWVSAWVNMAQENWHSAQILVEIASTLAVATKEARLMNDVNELRIRINQRQKAG